MSLQEAAAGMAAEGGVSSADSPEEVAATDDDDDLTTNTESEEEMDLGSDEEAEVDLGSCDEAEIQMAQRIQATERAVKVATKLARRMVKAWLWHDSVVMEAAVRQLPKVMVTRQVLFASGLIQVLRMRKETIWNVLSDKYRNRVATLYLAWGKKLNDEKKEELGGPVMKVKSLLGAYAKIPSLFMKRCQELEKWLHENAGWEAPFLVAQKVAMVLVAP